MNARQRHFATSMLAVVNFLWAAQYPAYKVASKSMPPVVMGFWTLLSATMLLFPFLWRESRLASAGFRLITSRKAVIQYFLLAFGGILPPAVMMPWGIERSTASNAAILSLTIPVLMTGLAVAMLGERLTVFRISSLCLALGGTVALSWSDFTADIVATHLLKGNIVIFLAGLGSAFFNTYAKVLLERFSELEVLVYSYISGALLCVSIAWVTGSRSLFELSGYSRDTWVAVFILGTVSWGGAMVLWMWVLRRLDASQVSVSIYLLSVFGVTLSAITLGERPGGAQIAGGLLVFAATYVVSVRETGRPVACSKRGFSGRTH